MKKVQLRWLFFLLASSTTLWLSCTETSHKKESPVVDIEDYKVNMPDLEGYAEFKAACITCHSLRYIEMQPDFPQKTWENIVNKMVKNFGAVIPDSTSKKIVTYLTQVKGVE